MAGEKISINDIIARLTELCYLENDSDNQAEAKSLFSLIVTKKEGE